MGRKEVSGGSGMFYCRPCTLFNENCSLILVWTSGNTFHKQNLQYSNIKNVQKLFEKHYNNFEVWA